MFHEASLCGDLICDSQCSHSNPDSLLWSEGHQKEGRPVGSTQAESLADPGHPISGPSPHPAGTDLFLVLLACLRNRKKSTPHSITMLI